MIDIGSAGRFADSDGSPRPIGEGTIVSAIPDPSSAASATPLPSGTVTFAFTDIEGSTVRWERDPHAMENAVRRHDALMRAAIAEHGGYVFKTVGDAFCAAFWRPQDAIAAMLAAQRALTNEDFDAVDALRVRAALHTGTADERDGDYFGNTVNRVARLLAVAHGGQVLVSGVTGDLARAALPAHASLRDLGEHRLKDLREPERVYQLLAPELAADFPPLRSLQALQNNLPLTLTSFVGRETEVAEIGALLSANRIVTLVGSGGIGKTRTALQVAADMLDRSVDGVWFIELAPLGHEAYLPATIASALGITLPSQGNPAENLIRVVQAKHALLVFDNCEHLIEPTASIVSALLRGCPNIKILASSRQALVVAGEVVYRMPSLQVPNEPDAARLTAAGARGYAATALFIERAHAVDRRFVASDENAPIIADICRRLDGIALAIELAAARVRLLSPRQLRERLDERFRVLTGGSRDLLPRQQTLRALIDWSYDLLDERERLLFRRLGIFVNGFTIEGAIAVAADDGQDILDEYDVFDVLASLVDKSLVLAEADGDSLRYRLLESTRAYALEKMQIATERESAASAHLKYLRNRFAVAHGEYEKTGRQGELDALFVAEVDDVRSALERAIAGPEISIGAELLVATGNFAWRRIGAQAECLARSEAFANALTGEHPQVRAALLTLLSNVARSSGRAKRAVDAAEAAIREARNAGDVAAIARAQGAYAAALWRAGRYAEGEVALAEAQASPNPSTALQLNFLSIAGNFGDNDEDPEVWERLREAHRILGNRWPERQFGINLAEVLHKRGETDRAIAILEELLPSTRVERGRDMLGMILTNLAGYFVSKNDLRARVTAREAIGDCASHEPDADWVAHVIEHLAAAVVRDDPQLAARLEGYANVAMRKLGSTRFYTENVSFERVHKLLDERLTESERDRLIAEGAALTAEQAIALALR